MVLKMYCDFCKKEIRLDTDSITILDKKYYLCEKCKSVLTERITGIIEMERSRFPF